MYICIYFVRNALCLKFFWSHRTACGILVPQPGNEPGPSAMRAWSPYHWIPRDSWFYIFVSLLLFKIFIYFWLCMLFSSWGAWTSSGFSYWEPQALGYMGSAVAPPRLWSTGWVVVVHGLSCFVACGIFPDHELNLSLALAGRFFTTEPPGKPLSLYIFIFKFGWPSF